MAQEMVQYNGEKTTAYRVQQCSKQNLLQQDTLPSKIMHHKH